MVLVWPCNFIQNIKAPKEKKSVTPERPDTSKGRKSRESRTQHSVIVECFSSSPPILAEAQGSHAAVTTRTMREKDIQQLEDHDDSGATRSSTEREQKYGVNLLKFQSVESILSPPPLPIL